MDNVSGGSAIDKLIEERLSSRTMSEQIQQAVGADKRLSQVSYGTFAEEGAIGAEFMPQGASPNLLPQKWAEYVSYTKDTAWLGSDDVLDNGSIAELFTRNVLLTYAKSATVSATLPYLDKQWNQFGPDGLAYIYSTDAIQYTNAAVNYVGLRIEAASDQSGTGAETIFETPDTTTDMWTLSGATGSSVRVYAKFVLPAGKPFLRVKHKVLTNPTSNVAWSNSMLEMIADFRSFPSKYAAPTPKAGELGIGQLRFGLSKNIMPYGKATMVEKFFPVAQSASTSDVSLNSILQGYVTASAIGDGISFNFNANNAQRYPTETWIPDSAPVNERLQPGTTYIASCDIKNMTAVDVTLTMRARVANSAFNLGTLVTNDTAATFTIPANTSTTPTRIFVRFTPPAGYEFGPLVTFQGLRASGSSSGLHNELRVENLMLEKLDADSGQVEPSPFALPVPGQSDIGSQQIENTYAAWLTNTASRSIASGATQQQPFAYGWKQRFLTTDMGTNYLFMPATGIYLIAVSILSSTSTADATRMAVSVVTDTEGSLPVGTVALQTTGAGTYNFRITGSVLARMQRATGFLVEVLNSSATSRNINAVHIYVIKIDDWGGAS